jgi:hypothetical protein
MALDAIVSPMPRNTCIRLDVRKDVDAITAVIQLNVYKIGQPAKVFQVPFSFELRGGLESKNFSGITFQS